MPSTSALAQITRRVAAVRRAGGRIALVDGDVPPVKPGMVLVEVHRSLVSPGSELGGWEAFRDGFRKDASEAPFGYSNAGIVLAVGDGVALPPGTRVAAIGAGYALHADYAVVPANLCFALPDNVDFEEGAYAMLLGTAMHAVRRAEVAIGDFTAVMGLGLLGALTARLLTIAGCRVIGWDTRPERCEIAHRLGVEATVALSTENAVERTNAFTRREGLDVAVWAMSGNADATWEATLDCMKLSADGHRMGRIVVAGHPEFTFRTRPMTNIDVVQAARTGPGYHDPAWEMGAAYPAGIVRWTTRRNIELCLDLVSRGVLPVRKLTTHRVPFTDVEEAIPRILSGEAEVLGVVFQMRGDSRGC